jgi:hypothetical protein
MKKSQFKSLIKSIIKEVINMGEPNRFEFNDFNWLGNMAGFGVPSDVKIGSMYIGTIESDSKGNGYRVVLVDTPKGKIKLPVNPKNLFKSKNLAADFLHRIWSYYRTRKASL